MEDQLQPLQIDCSSKAQDVYHAVVVTLMFANKMPTNQTNYASQKVQPPREYEASNGDKLEDMRTSG